MDRERFIELDRSGNGLTDEEYAQGFHWCYEWDQMLVGPGQPEALVCSCDHPKIEEWKQSDQAKQMLKDPCEGKYDIVSRLRDHTNRDDNDIAEAAAYIERLRAERDEARRMISEINDENERLSAELAAMRKGATDAE